jgi:glucose-1-phosphatase
MAFSAIVFDLGGVIIDLDVQRTYHAFSKFLGNGIIEMENGYLKNSVLRQYETGEIDNDQFLSAIEKLSNNRATKEEIIVAWNSMLVRIPDERIRLLEKLREKYRLFILSNTNSIHVDFFEKMAPGYEKLSHLFEDVFYSHLIGFRKPEQGAYLAVVKKYGINPDETLFVDDLAANIETARSLGFQTLHVTNGLDIIDWNGW